MEDRLKSRFGWGLTIAIEPPELETRVAILMRKAEENKIHLPHEVAFSSLNGCVRMCVSWKGVESCDRECPLYRQTNQYRFRA